MSVATGLTPPPATDPPPRQRSPVPIGSRRHRLWALDHRYAVALRHAALAKTTEALAAWWDTAQAQHDVAGVFWATLTHPRCNEALTHRVLGQLHLQQPRAGMVAPVDLDRVEALIDENAVLCRALASAQRSSQQLVADFTQRSDAQQAEIIRLRAQVMTQATERAQLQAALQQQRLAAAAAGVAPATAATPGAAASPRLDNHAVLCVGGRAAAVPLYRLIVERTGGRFMHHDGGEEDSSARLDATLAAADLVICQTGCVSHNAYWRVKDHCKRTGKRCVFVETPSTAGLKRALGQLAPATAGTAAEARPAADAAQKL